MDVYSHIPRDKIITAEFYDGRLLVVSGELWAHDHGRQLRILGIKLPEIYQVHFANEPHKGEAIPVTATGNIVDIPDSLLTSGKPVYAWVYVTPEVAVGMTDTSLAMPVNKRPGITDEEPDTEQQSAIDQAIGAVNEAVADARAAADEAKRLLLGLSIADGMLQVTYETEDEL